MKTNRIVCGNLSFQSQVFLATQIKMISIFRNSYISWQYNKQIELISKVCLEKLIINECDLRWDPDEIKFTSTNAVSGELINLCNIFWFQILFSLCDLWPSVPPFSWEMSLARALTLSWIGEDSGILRFSDCLPRVSEILSGSDLCCSTVNFMKIVFQNNAK